MMLDKNLIFSDKQAVTDHTADTPSTNIYNSGNANGSGDAGFTNEGLWLVVNVTETVTSAGAATVQAVVQDSANGVDFADVVAGPVVAKANAVAGTAILQIQPPPGMRQYWRFAYRVGVADLTAGKFDAFVAGAINYNVARASSFSVL